MLCIWERAVRKQLEEQCALKFKLMKLKLQCIGGMMHLRG